MIARLDNTANEVIAFRAEGKLHHEDYVDTIIPEINDALSHSEKISLMWEMKDFKGWDAHAAWDDIRLGFKINKNLKKIAVVGEFKWESWMSKCMSPFVKGEVRYFELKDEDDAMQWLHM